MFAVLSEVGRYPLTLKMLNSMCKNWLRIVHMKPDSLLYDCFLCNAENIHTGELHWLTTVRDTLCNLDFTMIWENIGLLTDDFPTSKFVKSTRNHFINQWQTEMNINSGDDKKLRTYSKFKRKFEIENYLLTVKDWFIKKNITRFRISAHNLKIETGRHRRPEKTPLEERVCELCNKIEDEIHLMLYCKIYDSERNIMFKEITDIFPAFTTLGDQEKFIFLMNLDDTEKIKIVETYFSKILKKRGSL